MKYYHAPRIHDGQDWIADPDRILVFETDETFAGILPAQEVDPALVQQIEGILCPGMVNAHCHVELSHTWGMIPEHTGLVGFLGQVMQGRAATPEAKAQAAAAALQQLEDSGCVAIGDIANTADMLQLRPRYRMHIHTFVEAMGFIPQTASQRMAYPEQVYRQYQAQAQHEQDYVLRQSIVPHAPYSVSKALFEQIDQFEPESLWSVHNEETPSENQYFYDKTGGMHALYELLQIDDHYFEPSGKTSLQTYIPYMQHAHDLILVHNTFMTPEDLDFLHTRKGVTSLCLCPNANWYIERTLPDIPMLAASGHNICLGTDSLASNHQLNVYEEVRTIQAHFPQIPLEHVLRWATSGGARALNLEDYVGRFRQGLRPGLVQIHEGKATRIL